jgi:hypothetical protein
MEAERDERIRRRAFALWEADGRPDGMEQEYWYRAEREIDAASAGDTPLPESLTTPARKTRAPRKAKTTAPPRTKRTPPKK